MTLKTYLGDGVWVDWDGEHVILRISDGTSDTDIIYLDASVLVLFQSWLARLEKLSADPHDGVPPSFSCE